MQQRDLDMVGLWILLYYKFTAESVLKELKIALHLAKLWWKLIAWSALSSWAPHFQHRTLPLSTPASLVCAGVLSRRLSSWLTDVRTAGYSAGFFDAATVNYIFSSVNKNDANITGLILRCGEIFNYRFSRNLLISLSTKKNENRLALGKVRAKNIVTPVASCIRFKFVSERQTVPFTPLAG